MKTNQDGRECPSWCVSDHQTGALGSQSCHGPRHVTGSARVSAHLYAWGKAPEVAAWLLSTDDIGTAYASGAGYAANLATFIELAADAPREDLRALAAHVREAAAEAWPGREPEAGS